MIELDAEIRRALKAHDRAALVGYRSLKAKVMNKLTEAGRGNKPLDDNEMLTLVRKEIKEREESNQFLAPDRPERQENDRIVEALGAHLPRALSAEELDAAIRKTFAEVKPAGPGDMGKVMAALRQVPGVDMAAASARVKELLQQQGR